MTLRVRVTGLAVFCAVFGFVAALPAAERAASPAVGPADPIIGQFTHDGLVVSYAASLEAPARASVRVEVGGLVLETWADFDRQVAGSDGHGGVMTAADRRAIAALFQELQPLLGGGPAGLAPHEGLLLRRLAYWSEAPVGTTFGAREYGPPAFGFGGIRPLESGRGCQYSDENGIRYFNCNVSTQVECHDANHCFTCALRAAGRNSSGCAGECGPGCNGLNIYTWDCLDHDYCCRFHGGCWNPWDGECGDEYWEADDDFLWGWPNC